MGAVGPYWAIVEWPGPLQANLSGMYLASPAGHNGLLTPLRPATWGAVHSGSSSCSERSEFRRGRCSRCAIVG